MTHTLKSKFAPGDRVSIDGDTSIIATITGVHWNAMGVQCECSWFASGDLKTYWIGEARLTPAPKQGEA